MPRPKRRRAPARKRTPEALPCPFCGVPPAVTASRARGEYARAEAVCETADCFASPKLIFFGGARRIRTARAARAVVIERWNLRAEPPSPCSDCGRLPVIAWAAAAPVVHDPPSGVQLACGCGVLVNAYKSELAGVLGGRAAVYRLALERWNTLHAPMSARVLAREIALQLDVLYELSENVYSDGKINALRTRLRRFASGKLKDFI